MTHPKEISWTIQASVSLKQKEQAEQLVRQFIKEIKVIGGEASLNSGMMMFKSENMTQHTVDDFKKLLRQQGMPEELIERQAKIMHAETADGSWDEIIVDIEEELDEAKRANELHKVYLTLLSLVNILVNQGYKPKAAGYFKEAETLFNETPVEKLINVPPDRPLTDEHIEQARKSFQKQLERLSNWLM